MLYVSFPLSLRNIEYMLHQRDIDICHKSVRQCWMRFGQIFAAEIRRKRASGSRAGSRQRRNLNEVFVNVNGERLYLPHTD